MSGLAAVTLEQLSQKVTPPPIRSMSVIAPNLGATVRRGSSGHGAGYLAFILTA